MKNSAIWNFFEKKSRDGIYHVVECKQCERIIKTCNTTNLKHHLERWHDYNKKLTMKTNEQNDDNEEDTSVVDKKFVDINFDSEASALEPLLIEESAYLSGRVDKLNAFFYPSEADADNSKICTFCDQTVCNNHVKMQNHLRECAGAYEYKKCADASEQDSFDKLLETICTTDTSRNRRSGVWQHFKHMNNRQTAECLLCGKAIKNYGNTTNLATHLRTHRISIEKIKRPMLKPAISKKIKTGTNHKRSAVWPYFKQTTPTNVQCLCCKRILSYCGNTTNMMSHIGSQHKDINLKNDKNQNDICSEDDMAANAIENMSVDRPCFEETFVADNTDCRSEHDASEEDNLAMSDWGSQNVIPLRTISKTGMIKTAPADSINDLSDDEIETIDVDIDEKRTTDDSERKDVRNSRDDHQNNIKDEVKITKIDKQDECDIFGYLVATQMRSLASVTRRKLKRMILSAILKCSDEDVSENI